MLAAKLLSCVPQSKSPQRFCTLIREQEEREDPPRKGELEYSLTERFFLKKKTRIGELNEEKVGAKGE